MINSNELSKTKITIHFILIIFKTITIILYIFILTTVMTDKQLAFKSLEDRRLRVNV